MLNGGMNVQGNMHRRASLGGSQLQAYAQGRLQDWLCEWQAGRRGSLPCCTAGTLPPPALITQHTGEILL